RSTDGQTWVRMTSTSLAGDEGNGELRGIVATGSSLVLVGSGYESGHTTPAAWISTDGGANWQRSSGDRFGETGYLVGVGRRGNTLVALGNVASSAAVWTSSDGGAQWHEYTDPTISGPSRGANAVLGTAQGFVAAGADGGSAAFWTSADGIRWTPNSYKPAGSEVQRLAMTPDGSIVATGGRQDQSSSQSGPVTAWRSGDGGQSWAAVTLPVDPRRPEAAVSDVTSIGGGLVAVGTQQADTQGSSRGIFWRSGDGRRWDLIKLPDEGGLPTQEGPLSDNVDADAALVFRDRVYVAGTAGAASPDGSQFVIWEGN